MSDVHARVGALARALDHRRAEPPQPIRRWPTVRTLRSAGRSAQPEGGGVSPFKQGLAEGRREGRELGLREGVAEGYQQGYTAGYADGLQTTQETTS